MDVVGATESSLITMTAAAAEYSSEGELTRKWIIYCKSFTRIAIQHRVHTDIHTHTHTHTHNNGLAATRDSLRCWLFSTGGKEVVVFERIFCFFFFRVLPISTAHCRRRARIAQPNLISNPEITKSLIPLTPPADGVRSAELSVTVRRIVCTGD
jgi:hypothetical protein